MDYYNEIEALKALQDKELQRHGELCKLSAEALLSYNDFKKEELEAYEGLQGLMIAIDELTKLHTPGDTQDL